MAPSRTIDLSDLRAQARACTPRPASAPAATPATHRSGLVPAVLVATAAVLAVSAGLPGGGITGLGGGRAEAAALGGSATVAAPVVPLPQTGQTADPASSSSERAARPTVSSRGASSCTAPCSTSQVISVTIEPGPFEVTAAPDRVPVVTDGSGIGRARLDGVRVTDLRGAGAGWTLSTRVLGVVDSRTGAAVPRATVELAPVCVRTAGPLTLESADPSVVRVGGTASLCLVPIASQGSLAGGLVSAYADIVVRDAPADTPLTVRFRTSLY
jgi:hypothetical protein